jgi:hypothetical protein
MGSFFFLLVPRRRIMLPTNRRRPIVVAVCLCCAFFALVKFAGGGRAWGVSSDASATGQAADEILAGTATPTPVATHFSVTAPSAVIQYFSFNVTVTALDQFNNVVTGYPGTIHFTSTDINPNGTRLPPDSLLTNGTGSFLTRLGTPGFQTVTATDTIDSSITGTTGPIFVNAKGMPTPTPTPSPSPSPTCIPAYSVLSGCAPFIPGTTDIGNHCDTCYNFMTLPFPVRLYENIYTQVSIDSNGGAYFVGSPAGVNGCLPFAGVTNAIFPYADDLTTVADAGACTQYPGGQCGIFTAVGTSGGHQTFTIEWRTVYADDTSQRANFELRLIQGESFFDVIYGTVDRGNTSSTAGVQHDPQHSTQAFCNGGPFSASGDHWYVLNGCGFVFPTPTPLAGPGCGGGSTPTPTPPVPTPTPTPTLTPPITPTPGLTTVQFSTSAYIDDESNTATITVTRLFSHLITSTVHYATANGTAFGGASCTSNVDYISASGTLTFAPDVESQTFQITLCPDNVREPDETVNLTLSNPTGATLGSPNAAILTINDTATQFKNPADIVINANLPADLYPSTITVAGAPTTVGSMRVTLYDYSASNAFNTGVLLVSPGGVKFILMAGTGGFMPVGTVTLNLTDTAGQVMPQNNALLTADYEPTSWIPIVGYPAPAPPPPYNIPGHDIGGTGTQTFTGNFGGTNPNGVWSLYVRDSPPPPGAGDIAEIISGHFAGGWGIEFLEPTAAEAAVSGRVTTADGSGIRNARVVITGNSLPSARIATTGSFGYFSFEGLTIGETYLVTVNSQRYTFTTPSRVITLVDNIFDADFVADQ